MRWRDAGDSGGGSVAGSSGSFEEALRRVTVIVDGDTVNILNRPAPYRISSDAIVPEREADRRLRLAASTSAIDSAELDGESTTIKLSDLLAKQVIPTRSHVMNSSNSVTFRGVEGRTMYIGTMYIGRSEDRQFLIGSDSPSTYRVYIRDDRIDIRPERLERTVDDRIKPFARAGATPTKIATYSFPPADLEPYPAGTPINGSWLIASTATPDRYEPSDDNIALRIPRNLPATLSGFYGEVKVGSTKVSTFIVPWTLVVAPTSTSALTLNAHNVEQGYYMTIPDNNQNGYSVMLVVQRQAVNNYKDAIYFRGCGNNIPAIPAGVPVTVDLYELLS